MLTNVVLSCFLILTLSSCCNGARKYDFSKYKNLKPYPNSISGMFKGTNLTFKYLTHGEPCAYEFNKRKLKMKAPAWCIEDARLGCGEGKCACEDTDLQWDPTVQAVKVSEKTDKEAEKQELIIGACAAIKGKECTEYIHMPESYFSRPCLDGLTCVFGKTAEAKSINDDSAVDFKKGICQ